MGAQNKSAPPLDAKTAVGGEHVERADDVSVGTKNCVLLSR